MKQRKHLGNFEVTSGKVILTDPCYQFDAAKVVPAYNGEWTSFVWVDPQGYTLELVAMPVAFINRLFEEKNMGFTCPVDSGQAGIFDADKYAQYQGGEFDQTDTFYGQVCYLTCDRGGGVVTMGNDIFGAVSTTDGDGNYELLGCFYDNQLVGITFRFNVE